MDWIDWDWDILVIGLFLECMGAFYWFRYWWRDSPFKDDDEKEHIEDPLYIRNWRIPAYVYGPVIWALGVFITAMA